MSGEIKTVKGSKTADFVRDGCRKLGKGLCREVEGKPAKRIHDTLHGILSAEKYNGWKVISAPQKLFSNTQKTFSDKKETLLPPPPIKYTRGGR